MWCHQKSRSTFLIKLRLYLYNWGALCPYLWMHIGRACLTNFLTKFFDEFFDEFYWRIFFTCILEENFVHVCGCILEELVMRIEDNDRDFTVAQNAQLVGFFHQTKLSLCESDLTIPLVCNSGNRDFLTTHFFLILWDWSHLKNKLLDEWMIW